MMALRNTIQDIIHSRIIHTTDFNWASREFLPTPYFSRGETKRPLEIIELVLSSDQIWYSIRQLNGNGNGNDKNNEKSEAEIRQLIQTILLELTHDFRMYSVRWFGLALAKLSKTLYSGIQVDESIIHCIRDTYKNYPIVLLPTHRSYVDFLLISYVSFHYDLSLPIIAAGMDFMGMAGVGEMLRKAGAFYIRRTFGGDLLYWAIVSEYVRKAVLLGGHPLEMFIEGTRSRSGKSLRPKIGLLSAILELVRTQEVPDVYIVPIAISYDRTLEETLYAHELLGMPKLRESTQGLFKALLWLRTQSYGNIYVRFGEPISFRKYLDEKCCPDSKPKLTAIPSQQQFTTSVKSLAQDVILSHQNSLCIPLISGISLILLSNITHDRWIISFQQLLCSMKELQQMLNSVGTKFGYPMLSECLEKNLYFIINIHSSILLLENEQVIAQKPPEPALLPIYFMKLQHYCNQILPKLLPFCITSLLIEKDTSEPIKSISKLQDDYVFLRQLLKPDFMYINNSELNEFELIMKYFTNTSTVLLDKSVSVSTQKVLRQGIESYLFCYGSAMKVLLQQLPPDCECTYDMKEISLKIQEAIKNYISSEKYSKQYSSLSLETVGNCFVALIGFGAVKKVNNNRIVICNYDLLGVMLDKVANVLKIDWELVAPQEQKQTSKL